MIDLKQEQVEELLEEILEKVEDETPSLVSITRKINKINPLSFYEAAKYTEKDRVFWLNEKRDFCLVGVGRAHEIIAKGTKRFKKTSETWNRILEKAIINNPYKVEGTGIVALGGMSFDPQKKATQRWSKYKDSLFTIPEFMLTYVDDSYYYTVNLMVTKHDHPFQLANQLKEIEFKLFDTSQKKAKSWELIEKEEIDVEKWKETVHHATEEIKNGYAEKIVLAREMRVKFNHSANHLDILQGLIEKQRNSYIFAFNKDDDCFLGATPERLVKVEKELLYSTCLAGTAPRGETEEEDKILGNELLHDDKNRREHDYVVQMIKEAIENYCTNVMIPKEPVLYPLKNLQHLYTPVTAVLKNGHSIFDVIEKLHPTPALGGEPKSAAMTFIRDFEHMDRGWYGAPIGWVDSNQNGEFAVAIRSALIKGEEASLYAGCGVVDDSNPEVEYQETNIKFLPMLTVLGGQD